MRPQAELGRGWPLVIIVPYLTREFEVDHDVMRNVWLVFIVFGRKIVNRGTPF